MLLRDPKLLYPQIQSYQVSLAISVAGNLRSACWGQWGFLNPHDILLRNISNPYIHLIGKISFIYILLIISLEHRLVGNLFSYLLDHLSHQISHVLWNFLMFFVSVKTSTLNYFIKTDIWYCWLHSDNSEREVVLNVSFANLNIIFSRSSFSSHSSEGNSYRLFSSKIKQRYSKMCKINEALAKHQSMF